VAGRSIGGDKISHAAVRNMMCCAVGGQGAGVAAAISVKHAQPFDRLEMSLVQAELRRQGRGLPERDPAVNMTTP
jgi:hypothetical protein